MIEQLALSPILRVVVLALVFVLLVAIVLLVYNFASNRILVRGRLDQMAGGPMLSAGGAGSLRSNSTQRGWAKLAEKIEKAGISLVDTKGDVLRSRMIAAGYDSPAAPKIFTLSRIILLIALPAIFILITYFDPKPMSTFKLYATGVLTALAGLYLPNLFISAKIDRRQQEITNDFPDCLDLMLVCVEAGLGMESAFDRVGREMVHSHPLVAKMLSAATLELRAGATREEALRNMADRAQVDEIRSFTTLLIQSDKLGSSIGDTLRVYAAEMREKRKLRAEEKAHRLPVLLAIPLVSCMLPVMIGVIMLPAAVRVVRQLLPALGS